MSRRPKNPLRPLLETARQSLRQISRSQVAPAIQVARAKALLSVAEGSGYTKAAQKAGRRSGDAIATLVTRFNGEGIAAVVPKHGGGQLRRYSAREREQSLAEARRVPDREQDGAAVWSLTTLQRALRKQGFLQISRSTIHQILLEAR